MKQNLSIVMLGATGAVGTATLQALLTSDGIDKVTTIGRRIVDGKKDGVLEQKIGDIFDTASYADFLNGHEVAVCTLGVGQPSKVSKEQFTKVDKLAVLAFAQACQEAGVTHFQLLASVGTDAKSSSFYLRTKGELIEELQLLKFERLSIFQPLMILTPTNRYGPIQGITLKLWPIIHKSFLGGLKKYKGVKVSLLGEAIAKNCFVKKKGTEFLTYLDFINLTN